MNVPTTLMPPDARVRLHELLYARASFLEAESCARRLRTTKHEDEVTTSLITSMVVAYVRPFMRTNSPDGTKKVHVDHALAEKIDAGTHRNLVKVRHEVCAHKDLSLDGVNIPVVRVSAPQGVEFHSLRVIEIAPDECVLIEKLCLKLAGEVESMVGDLLRLHPARLPAPGVYTISHDGGPWLIPLDKSALRRTNLERDTGAQS